MMRGSLCATLLLLACAVGTGATSAQDRGARRGRRPAERSAQPAPKEAPKPAEAPAAAEASDEVRREGDKDVKTLEFTGLDIEGQLKTPQMLYFLRRLRAEFGRPELPHRSFLPELQRATKEKAF